MDPVEDGGGHSTAYRYQSGTASVTDLAYSSVSFTSPISQIKVPEYKNIGKHATYNQTAQEASTSNILTRSVKMNNATPLSWLSALRCVAPSMSEMLAQEEELYILEPTIQLSSLYYRPYTWTTQQ
jgi:hypothetical protein